MNVGIDVDGVLVNVDDFIHDVGSKIWGPIKDPSKYSAAGRFGRSDEEDRYFWDKYRMDYVQNQSPVFGIVSLQRYLKETNTPYWIITNRGCDARDPDEKRFIMDHTREFIDNWMPQATEIIFNDIGTKLSACLEHKIDVMIDDSAANLEVLVDHMKCIVVDHPHNVNFKHPNAVHVKDLSEVPHILEIFRGIKLWKN